MNKSMFEVGLPVWAQGSHGGNGALLHRTMGAGGASSDKTIWGMVLRTPIEAFGRCWLLPRDYYNRLCGAAAMNTCSFFRTGVPSAIGYLF
jgi:hypothetical protein